jgi:photosystem II stability/assembly factor-like uncharacterized protein
MFICLSPGGQMTTQGDARRDTLLVGTVDGIFSFARSSAAWSQRAHFLPGEHVSALLFEPESRTLFAGTFASALHASSDLGKTWERRDRGLRDMEIYSLACQKIGGQTRLYAGTQPAHLFQSDDLGKSWSELTALREVPGVDKWTFPGPPHQAHVKSLAFDPKRPETIYAAVEVGGFLKSDDGGRSWRTVEGLNPDAHRVLTTNDPGKVYHVMPTTNCGPETTAGVCISADGGSTWTSLTPRDFRIGYVDPLLVHPFKPDLMFVAGGKTGPGTWRKLHTADSRIARSRDGGKSWEVLTNGLPEHIRGNVEAFSIDAWSGGSALFAGTTDGDVFASEDEGDSWKKIISGIGAVSKAHHYQNLQESAA